MMCPYAKTEDGFEMQFATNYLGHFLLVQLLLPFMKAKSRIVITSSVLHKVIFRFSISRKKYGYLFTRPARASQPKQRNIALSVSQLLCFARIWFHILVCQNGLGKSGKFFRSKLQFRNGLRAIETGKRLACFPIEQKSAGS